MVSSGGSTHMVKQEAQLLEDEQQLPQTNRKLYQCFVLFIATASIMGQGLAAGSAGFILPQIWDKSTGGSIQVSRETGAWFGKEGQFTRDSNGYFLPYTAKIWNES